MPLFRSASSAAATTELNRQYGRCRSYCHVASVAA